MSRTAAMLMSTCLCSLGIGGAAVTTHPATAPSTQTTLQTIELTSGIYLAGSQTHITVSIDGRLSSEFRIENTFSRQGVVRKQLVQSERREGQLTADQAAELMRLFTAWDTLLSEPYGGVADGEAVSVRYGNKTVSGGSFIPRRVAEVKERLMEFARQTPLVVP